VVEPARGFSAAVCVARVLIFLPTIIASKMGPDDMGPIVCARGREAIC
jgi:hypothetical protein